MANSVIKKDNLLIESNVNPVTERITQELLKCMRLRNTRVVFVYGVFKTTTNIAATQTVVKGFPPAFGLGQMHIPGINSGNNTRIMFILTNTGELATDVAIPSNTWCSFSGAYLTNSD